MNSAPSPTLTPPPPPEAALLKRLCVSSGLFSSIAHVCQEVGIQLLDK